MDTSFGQAVKRHRLAAGITITELAHRAGIDHSHVSRIEAGLREPAVSIAVRIADALNVDIAELCGARTKRKVRHD